MMKSLLHLQVYCDSNYVEDKFQRKNTSEACQFLEQAITSWQCKKQSTHALFITKVEYV